MSARGAGAFAKGLPRGGADERVHANSALPVRTRGEGLGNAAHLRRPTTAGGAERDGHALLLGHCSRYPRPRERRDTRARRPVLTRESRKCAGRTFAWYRRRTRWRSGRARGGCRKNELPAVGAARVVANLARVGRSGVRGAICTPVTRLRGSLGACLTAIERPGRNHNDETPELYDGSVRRRRPCGEQAKRVLRPCVVDDCLVDDDRAAARQGVESLLQKPSSRQRCVQTVVSGQTWRLPEPIPRLRGTYRV
jgi:hypothetical protein